ncbi:TonB-dependent receptor, partial [Candidatus Neomarinimicrobiota bacterium]
MVLWTTVVAGNPVAVADILSARAFEDQPSLPSRSLPSRQDTTSGSRSRWITPRFPADTSDITTDFPVDGYRLEPVTIIGIRQKITRVISPVTIIIDDDGSSDDAIDALRRLPVVFLKSYGGAGSVHSLSVNGGAASHTAVLLDGISINSPQNGELDLALIPLDLIGEIEYISHGGFPIQSTTGLSGVVNLSPSKPVTGVAYTGGSFGRQELRSSLSLGEPLSVQIGAVNYAGDFPYSFREQNQRRQNNEFHQRYAFLDSRLNWLGRGNFDVRLWLVDNRKGVPGQVWSP